MRRASRNLFCISAGVILVITGVAKIWSAFGHAKVLLVNDPLLGLKFDDLMIIAGALELIVACVCFFSKSALKSAGVVAWLTTSFLFYRIGLWLIGWHKLCPCLGNLTDALHIPPQAADTAMKGILVYLLLGSYATLFWLWLQPRSGSMGTPAP